MDIVNSEEETWDFPILDIYLSFCSSVTSWVFWSGAMRAYTVARISTCNQPQLISLPCVAKGDLSSVKHTVS